MWQQLLETAQRIKIHNSILEVIEEQISYDLSRSFDANAISSSEAVNRLRSSSTAVESFDKTDEGTSAGAGSGGALHGLFQFIDFVQLQVSVNIWCIEYNNMIGKHGVGGPRCLRAAETCPQ